MSKLFKILLTILFFIAIAIAGYLSTRINWSELSSTINNNDPGLYKVVSVADGDTIIVDMNGTDEKIRFIGIDTPEKNHPDFAVQCFALEAEQHLREVLGTSKVRLEADPQNSNRDVYDRLLRFVYLPDGTFVNGKMVEDGYAFAYTGYSNSKLNEFRNLESRAREANIGLWNSCDVDINNGRPLTNPA